MAPLNWFLINLYWILSPEDKTLIAYALDDGSYRVIDSVECGGNCEVAKVRIPPFEELEIDLRYVFGDEVKRGGPCHASRNASGPHSKK